MNLITELKRRKVFKVGAAYLVVGWLMIEVSATVLPQLNFPEWAPRLVTFLILLGLPITLVLAWIYEMTPDGVKLDARASGSKRVFAVAAVLAVLALGWFLQDRVLPAPTATAPAAQSQGPVAAQKVPTESIAVLPFVNMSADPENEYFADGLSEEILNSLARIDGLQVVGRTSSFQFKGKSEDLRTIGNKLGVANVLEGSVRREGDKARITAQLVRASDGIHLWSQTYDRKLDDTLAVQLDIAEQVAGVLNIVLDNKQLAVMREAGVKNVEAFIAYQKGLKLYDDAHYKPDTNLFDGLRLANAEFAKATELEPTFFEPLFAAADLHEHILDADDASHEQRIDAQREAMKILGLAAAASRDQQQRLLTLVERQMFSDDWHGLAANIDAAFEAPGCNGANWLRLFASAFGYEDAIEDFSKRASACDPLNLLNYNTRIWAALANGHPQRALSAMGDFERIRSEAPYSRTSLKAKVLASLGRIDEARKILDAVPSEQRNNYGYYVARVILGRASGESPEATHAALKAVDRSNPRAVEPWGLAEAIEIWNAGDRAETNRNAAAFDARPAGGFLLARIIAQCQCGAPFDLDATPNFKARLAESGLRWPPPDIKYPARAQDATP